MQGRWQAGMMAGLAVALCAVAPAADKEAKFEYKAPVVGKGMFDDRLVMLDRERGEYASNLASYAANQIAATRASKSSIEEARRLLALAMHLSPRNQKALVVNHQLSRGVLPETTDGGYSPGVFARLLLTRAQLLLREGGIQDTVLARAFIELATAMDPRNEEAVYAFELQRLDHGDFDWSQITDYKEPQPKLLAPTPVPIPPPVGPDPMPAPAPGSDTESGGGREPRAGGGRPAGLPRGPR